MKSLAVKMTLCTAALILSACVTDPYSVKPETNAKLPKSDATQPVDIDTSDSILNEDQD